MNKGIIIRGTDGKYRITEDGFVLSVLIGFN